MYICIYECVHVCLYAYDQNKINAQFNYFSKRICSASTLPGVCDKRMKQYFSMNAVGNRASPNCRYIFLDLSK